ncbi:uncharacterized protein BDZ99DRAFT_450202, partial [Mytilinidion resinicola]
MCGDSVSAVMEVLSAQHGVADEVKDLTKSLNARWAMETHIALDKKRCEVLNYFGKISPLSNHKTNLKLWHPTTGLWLTEGLVFQNWLRTIKNSGPGRAVAYFYCDYKSKDRQDPILILGSLATQLARQKEEAYSLLGGLFAAYHPKDESPSHPELEHLTDVLQRMAALFDDVSIVVDALDECLDDSETVVNSLVSLNAGHTSNIRTLFLSRDEVDIRQLLIGREYIEVPIVAQSDDLKAYVAAEIVTRERMIGRKRLRLGSSELKEHISKTLVERAKGMFRWVTCQLDYLCELPTDAMRRDALYQLPPTLNKTYERILRRINPAVRLPIQRALQMIGHYEILAPQLCEAMSIEPGCRVLNKEAWWNIEEILLHCSSLVRRSHDSGELELAHFSVQEYLASLDPNSNSELAGFSLQS